jgi:hypothetical protein
LRQSHQNGDGQQKNSDTEQLQVNFHVSSFRTLSPIVIRGLVPQGFLPNIAKTKLVATLLRTIDALSWIPLGEEQSSR